MIYIETALVLSLPEVFEAKTAYLLPVTGGTTSSSVEVRGDLMMDLVRMLTEGKVFTHLEQLQIRGPSSFSLPKMMEHIFIVTSS